MIEDAEDMINNNAPWNNTTTTIKNKYKTLWLCFTGSFYYQVACAKSDSENTAGVVNSDKI